MIINDKNLHINNTLNTLNITPYDLKERSTYFMGYIGKKLN